MKSIRNFFSSSVLRFKHFSRKAYAVFASMHRQVTIGRVCRAICDKELLKSGVAILNAVVLGCISPITIWAEQADVPDEVADLTLQEVQVISQQTEIYSQAYRLVSVIDRTSIASLPVNSVSDILATLPGLDIRTRGTNGSQADVSMRGGTFDQVLICLNGIALSDAQTGHYALNLPVPLSSIERIEVLQGAAASLNGGSAFTGAINIVTIQPQNDRYHTELQLGMNKYGHLEFTGGWKRKDCHVVASGNYSHANGYYAPNPSEKEQTALTNSDLNIVNLFSSVSYRGLDIQLGAQYKDAGAGMFYGFGSQDQFDATRTAFGSAHYGHNWGNWSIEAQASYRANYDRYEWHRGQRLYGNFHFAQNSSAALSAHYASAIGKTSFGIHFRNENIRSTNLGDTINPNGQVPNVEGFKLADVRVLDLVKGANRYNIAYFAQQTFHTHGFSASLAASGIYNSYFGHHWTAGVDLGYSIDGWNIYANANRSVRMPTFTDLYYNAGNQLGDRNLRPEKAVTASIGASYQHHWEKAGTLNAQLDGFYRLGQDIIDWVYVASDTKRPYHAANQQRINTLGVETIISYRWNQWLKLVQLSYGYTYLDLNLQEAQSRYLDYLRHKLVARIEHGIYKGLGASWTLTYRDRVGQYNNAQGDVQDFRPVVLLDGAIFYDFPQCRIMASCTNMTNRHYYDYGGILQPGAWFKLSFNYHF